MGKLCACNDALKNTGYDCANNPSVTIMSYMMNRYKSDGSLNGIDFDADAVDGVIPDAVIQAKLNDPNPLDRWYPIGLFENLEDVRAEILSQTFNSGNSVKIKDGIRSFNGLLIKKSPSYVGVLESFGCKDVAVMHVDDQGNLIGESLDGNFLRGINVDQNTISAIYVKTSDTEVSAINYTYNYAQTVDDSNIMMIEATATETDLKSTRGLLDVTLSEEVVPVAASGTEVSATVNYGASVSSKLALKSLLLADFDVKNVTQSAVVTLSSATLIDSDKGLYLLTWASGVTAGDVLSVTATKQGYEFNLLTMSAAV